MVPWSHQTSHASRLLFWSWPIVHTKTDSWFALGVSGREEFGQQGVVFWFRISAKKRWILQDWTAQEVSKDLRERYRLWSKINVIGYHREPSKLKTRRKCGVFLHKEWNCRSLCKTGIDSTFKQKKKKTRKKLSLCLSDLRITYEGFKTSRNFLCESFSQNTSAQAWFRMKAKWMLDQSSVLERPSI